MYESRKHRPLPRDQFLRRMLRHFLGAIGLMGFSLGVGIAGYMRFEGLPALDAFLNAAMLLGGMGPVDAPMNAAGKFFAGCYALYAGMVFIVATGVILAPVAHRILHKLHWDEES
jgi:hypothetical protein